MSVENPRPLKSPVVPSSDLQTSLRIADANGNRVMEGLRTLEDLARFTDRGRLQSEYKGIRHALQRCLQNWNRNGLLAARSAQHDVGRKEKQPAEMDRSSGLDAIAASAAGRVEQGLRVLEEIAKFVEPQSASEIEALRYRIYDLNAQFLLDSHRNIDFLRRAHVYALVDCQLPITEFVARLQQISDAGVDLVQIRDKNAEGRQIVEYTQAAIEAIMPTKTRVIVNDRADIAKTCNAWGTHVGQDDLTPVAVRSVQASHQVLGLSTHSIDQIEVAIASRVDYIGCGPTFPSTTKSFASFAGTDFLRTAVQYLASQDADVPAFAIGGISHENVSEVVSSGFTRVAVGSAIWSADRPDKNVRLLRKEMGLIG